MRGNIRNTQDGKGGEELGVGICLVDDQVQPCVTKCKTDESHADLIIFDL